MIHNHCKEDIIKQRIDNVLDIDTMRDAEDDLKNIDPLFPLNLRNLQDCICPECLFKAPSIDVLQKHMQKVFITELCGGKLELNTLFVFYISNPNIENQVLPKHSSFTNIHTLQK